MTERTARDLSNGAARFGMELERRARQLQLARVEGPDAILRLLEGDWAQDMDRDGRMVLSASDMAEAARYAEMESDEVAPTPRGEVVWVEFADALTAARR